MKKLWLSLILAIGLLLPIAHSPVNHLPVFTPTVANALTGYVDPNGDVSVAWNPTPASTHYTAVDEGARQPSTSSPLDLTDYVGSATISAVETFSMSTLTGVSSVSNITVWAYGEHNAGPNDATPNIYMAGAWTTSVAKFGLTDAPVWKSVSFDGNWSQADLDAMQIKLVISQVTGGPARVYETYAVVTYAAGGGGGETPTPKPYFIKKKKGVVFFK